jgi:hypothetical protein
MTKDEALAMDLALEALEIQAYNSGDEKYTQAITAIKQARSAQPAPVQEPDYAWPTVDDYEKDVGFQVGEAFKMAWNMARTTNGFLKLLSGEAAPPAAKRQWVGLTLADREKLRDQFEGWNYPAILVDAVADILKEKNT